MNKMLDEKGNLTEWGHRVCIDLKYGLEQLMTSDDVKEMTENELQVLGGLLAKMVAEPITNRISFKRQLQNSLDAMSDEDFEAYLKEKYGTIWQLITVNEEEQRRYEPIARRAIEKVVEAMTKISPAPCNGVRFPTKPEKRYK